MAILKVDLPAGKKLVPLPLMANELKIGEDVCALGWPGVMSQNLTLTLTKGVVSTLPDTDDNESFIVTDCTVNPGNSGGPLCSFARRRCRHGHPQESALPPTRAAMEWRFRSAACASSSPRNCPGCQNAACAGGQNGEHET